jgi:hypothetical protein
MFSSQNISIHTKKYNMSTVQTKTETFTSESQIGQNNNIVPMLGVRESSTSDTTSLPLPRGNISSHLLFSRPRQRIGVNNYHVPGTHKSFNSPQKQQHHQQHLQKHHSETRIKIDKLSFGSTGVHFKNNEGSPTHFRRQDSEVGYSNCDSSSQSDARSFDHTVLRTDEYFPLKNEINPCVGQNNGLSHLGSKPKKTDSFQLKTLVKQSLDSDTCTLKSINKSGRALGKSEGIRSEDNNVAGTYGNDINIIEIHRIVMDKMQADSDDRISELKRKMDLEIAEIKKPQNIVDRRNSIRAIKSYRAELDTLKSSVDLENYLKESRALLDNYMEIGVKLEVVSFGKEKKESDVCQIGEEQEYRIMIIERYLEIARKYTEVNIFKKYNNHCMNCRSDISLSELNDIGMLVCSVCGTETVTLATTISYNEESAPINANVGNLKDYEDRENFYKAMIKYQGKQPNKLQPHLYEKLDEYFISINYPIGKEISAMQLNDDIGTSIKTRGNSSRSLMLKALKDIGMSNHYEDINLLCQLYWGWKLPDLSNLEETIMKDYDLSQEVFERHKGDRKSCLNIQYRLWRHLSRRGHPCKPNNFKIIKTPEIIKYYERIWEIICKELGWDQPLSLN